MRLMRVLSCAIISVEAGVVFSFRGNPNISSRYQETKKFSFLLNLASPHASITALASWTTRLQQLKDYKMRAGDTLVPKIYPENQPLGNWVNKQRQRRKRGKINEDQIRALDELGFIWDASNIKKCTKDLWWERFEELRVQASQSGFDSIKSDSRTGFWMNRQRKLYKLHSQGIKSILSQDMIEAMNAVNFPWKSKREQIWDSRILELQAYKSKHGHCIVPISYEANPQLANWVSSQRKNGKFRDSGRPAVLSHKRKQQLESLGFVWNPWDHKFKQMHTKFSEKVSSFDA